MIIRFATERVRDSVYHARVNLKEHNRSAQPHQQLFINEDLMSRRSTLAFETRKLKKTNKINYCWTFQGQVIIKDKNNAIKKVTSISDLKA
ncbi:hypothetical protein LSAT2_027313 [Lamellibrachia satsuma]|nr:hypothetical protein LSAT2_027313 [Lamellibrachia satsuma]